MTTLLLVRHGRSVANATGVLAGRAPGVPLDEVGQAQAAELRAGLAGVSRAYSSPLERCVATARLAGFAAPLVVDALTEVDYGELTGRRFDDEVVLGYWSRVCTSPEEVSFPAGERLSEVQERVLVAARTIAHESRGRTVAVFTHGDPIKLIIADALGMPFANYQRIQVSPGSVSIVEYGATPSVRGISISAGASAAD